MFEEEQELIDTTYPQNRVIIERDDYVRDLEDEINWDEEEEL